MEKDRLWERRHQGQKEIKWFGTSFEVGTLLGVDIIHSRRHLNALDRVAISTAVTWLSPAPNPCETSTCDITNCDRHQHDLSIAPKHHLHNKHHHYTHNDTTTPRQKEGGDGLSCPSPIIGMFFKKILSYCTDSPNFCRHNDVTRRVSPLLVTPNTIFDVARRGKTLLVTPNTRRVQRGNDMTHCGNNTTNVATTQPTWQQHKSPPPPSLEMRDGGGIFPSNQSPIPSLARNARQGV